MHNVLVQIRGSKRVVLLDPAGARNLYLNGDKSEVIDVDSPDLERFPRFARVRQRVCMLLIPGFYKFEFQ
jgi:tRNA wybutosine-synthesizing protein 5